MKPKTKILFYLPLFALMLTATALAAGFIYQPAPAKAAGWTPEIKILKNEENPSDVPSYIGNIYKFVSLAIGIFAVVMFMVGGFQYLTSAGNTAAVAAAKETMIAALAGMIIVLTAYTLLRIINKNLVDLQELEIDKIQSTGSGTTSSGSGASGTGEINKGGPIIDTGKANQGVEY
ncbi:MAG: hypothetical protein ABIC19_03890 [Patescibacteria group bacterium]